MKTIEDKAICAPKNKLDFVIYCPSYEKKGCEKNCRYALEMKGGKYKR